MSTPGATLPATTETLRWSTDAVEARHRIDYWVGAICECFLEMDASSPNPGRFGCELLSAPLHSLRVNRVRGSAQDRGERVHLRFTSHALKERPQGLQPNVCLVA